MIFFSFSSTTIGYDTVTKHTKTNYSTLDLKILPITIVVFSSKIIVTFSKYSINGKFNKTYVESSITFLDFIFLSITPP